MRPNYYLSGTYSLTHGTTADIVVETTQMGAETTDVSNSNGNHQASAQNVS